MRARKRKADSDEEGGDCFSTAPPTPQQGLMRACKKKTNCDAVPELQMGGGGGFAEDVAAAAPVPGCEPVPVMDSVPAGMSPGAVSLSLPLPLSVSL